MLVYLIRLEVCFWKVGACDKHNADTVYPIDDGTSSIQRARGTLCAMLSDTSHGRAHIHLITDRHAKQSIMASDKLNIFHVQSYAGCNFEYVLDPTNHSSRAKLILFDANQKGNVIDEVIGKIMCKTGYRITHLQLDNTGSPTGFIEPSSGQHYQAVEDYMERKAIADNLYDEYKWDNF